MARTSRFLSENSVRAFERIGTILMPRHENFPSFEELGVIVHIDEIMEHVPADDRGALNMLLGILYFFPTPLLAGFLSLIETGVKWKGAVGGFFRMLDTGFRSVVVTLYFSGKRGPSYVGQTPLDVIDYHVNPIR